MRLAIQPSVVLLHSLVNIIRRFLQTFDRELPGMSFRPEETVSGSRFIRHTYHTEFLSALERHSSFLCVKYDISFSVDYLSETKNFCLKVSKDLEIFKHNSF